MTTKPDGGPAFPRPYQPAVTENTCMGHKYTTAIPAQSGMSMRDWFAGMALNGVSANHYVYRTIIDHEGAAAFAYELADAMIKERGGE